MPFAVSPTPNMVLAVVYFLASASAIERTRTSEASIRPGSLASSPSSYAVMDFGCPTLAHKMRTARNLSVAGLPSCAHASLLASVRCCDQHGGCWSLCTAADLAIAYVASSKRQLIMSEEEERAFDGTAASHAQAEAACAGRGMRLCSSIELAAGRCCKAGCAMDPTAVWSSNACAASLCTGFTCDPRPKAPTAERGPAARGRSGNGSCSLTPYTACSEEVNKTRLDCKGLLDLAEGVTITSPDATKVEGDSCAEMLQYALGMSPGMISSSIRWRCQGRGAASLQLCAAAEPLHPLGLIGHMLELGLHSLVWLGDSVGWWFFYASICRVAQFSPGASITLKSTSRGKKSGGSAAEANITLRRSGTRRTTTARVFYLDTWGDISELQEALQMVPHDSIVVANQGLHMHRSEELATVVNKTLEILSLRQRETGGALQVIWRTSSAQHFSTQSGAHHADDGVAAPHVSQEHMCRPIRSPNSQQATWRRDVEQAVLHSHNRGRPGWLKVGLMHFHELSRPLWEQHYSRPGLPGRGPDCTHFCPGGPAWAGVWSELGKLVSRHINRGS